MLLPPDSVNILKQAGAICCVARSGAGSPGKRIVRARMRNTIAKTAVSVKLLFCGGRGDSFSVPAVLLS